MKILFIPLDERPCNYHYPVSIAEISRDVEIIAPSANILGRKKQPADIEALWRFVEEKAQGCEAAVLSLDMLLYGGIVPSRLHAKKVEELKPLVDRLRNIKKLNPGMKLYAFNLIMRIPAYSSSDEEPDYYGEYGREIYLYSAMMDRIQRNEAEEEDKIKVEELKNAIPSAYLEDYIGRRKVNEALNEYAVELVNEGIIDFMVVPQDDCSPYGFAAVTQRRLAQLIRKYELWDRVYIYPGADETGCTLVARAINELKGRKPKVFVRYNSSIGCNTVPAYEDRPVSESIKSHIGAAGGLVVLAESSADYVLLVNTPSDKMQECAFIESSTDNSYDRMRSLRELSEALEYYVNSGVRCAIADIAYANGADSDLVKMLTNRKLCTKLYGYAAWNTCGNTLGTVIAHAMVSVMEDSLESQAHQRFLLERFLEDWGYQSVLRRQTADGVLPGMGLEYRNLADKQQLVSELLKNKLEEVYDRRFSDFRKYNLKISRVYMPWNRMFEIGIEVGVAAPIVEREGDLQ